MKKRDWIIISVSTCRVLYGINNQALRFSTKDIAIEIADQMFVNVTEYLIVNINDLMLSK